MKMTLKELKGIVRHALNEAEKGKDEKEKEKGKKKPQDSGFSCPKHDKFLLPFFHRMAGKKDVPGYSPDVLKKHGNIVPPTKLHPQLGLGQQDVKETKTKVKFYYCPLREEEGPYGPPRRRKGSTEETGVACDYIVIPKETPQGKEYRAYGDVAREMGLIGVPIKRRVTQEKGQVPEGFMDELARMEAGGYHWKRIKGTWSKPGKISRIKDERGKNMLQKSPDEPGTPDKWVKVKSKKPKEFCGDDEHYLSYPYPMSLGKAQGKDGPAYFMSRDEVTRTLLRLGWTMADPVSPGGERDITPPSMPSRKEIEAPRPGSPASLSKLAPGWHTDDDEEDLEADPWAEDTDVDDEDDVFPERWKD